MPSPQIQFPAGFTTASALAYTNPDGSVQLVTTDNPIPVSMGAQGDGAGGLTDAQLRASPVSVSLTSFLGLTDTQLRASPLPVSVSGFSGLSDAQLRAAPVSVSLSSFVGLTDDQLRATPVPVSFTSFTGLTDTQLRASPLPVSLSSFGGLTDTQLRSSPVAVSMASFTGLTDTQLRSSPVAVSMASFTGLTDTQLRATPVGTAPDAVTDGLRTSGSVTAASVLVSVANTGFVGGSFHVTSAGTTCTITYEQSNDNTNWIALPVVSLAAANSSPALTTTAAGIYGFATTAAYVRARVSTYTSGTVALTLAQKRQAPPVTGVSLAGGASALGSVTITGTPGVLSNVGTGFTDSTTALAASATFTGTGRVLTSASQYAYFHAIAYADQAGTLFVEQSLDTGATYQAVLTQAVAANSAAQVTARLTGTFSSTTFYRVRYVNGAAAQTTFRLSSAFSR